MMDLVLTLDELQNSYTNAGDSFMESYQESTSSSQISEIAMNRANAIFESLDITIDDFLAEFEEAREDVFLKYYGSKE